MFPCCSILVLISQPNIRCELGPNKNPAQLSSSRGDIERSFALPPAERCQSDYVIVEKDFFLHFAGTHTRWHAHSHVYTHDAGTHSYTLWASFCSATPPPLPSPTDVTQYLGQLVCRWVVNDACISLGFHTLTQQASQCSVATLMGPERELLVIKLDGINLKIPNSIKVQFLYDCSCGYETIHGTVKLLR